MSDIYLLYSNADEAIARKIFESLEAAKYVVATANDDDYSTADNKRAVRDTVRDASSLVVVLSPNATRSEYVEDAVALARLKHLPTFPVLIEGELRRATPLGLRVGEYVDCREDFDGAMKFLMGKLAEFFAALEEEDSEHEHVESRRGYDDYEDEAWERKNSKRQRASVADDDWDDFKSRDDDDY